MVSRLAEVYRVWCGVFFITVTIGMAGAWCGAQEQPDVPVGDVIVVASAPPDWNVRELEQFLQAAIKEASGCQFTGLEVRAIDPAVYQWLASLFPDVGNIAAASGKSVIVRNRDASQQWDVRTDPFTQLEGLEVRYVDKAAGPEEKSEVFPSKGLNDKDARLRYRQPGWWIFQTEETWEPREYRLIVADEKQARPFERWPLPDQYYAIRLKSFRGDIRTYFETLTDPNKVGNALRDLRVPTATSLLLTSFKRMIPPRGGVWGDANRFTVLVSRLPGLPAARVWMLFPLTKSEAEKAAKELQDLHDAQGSKLTSYELARAIADGEFGYKSYNVARNTEGKLTKLTAGTPAQWYEVPPVYSTDSAGRQNLDGFQRTFDVDIPSWRQDPLAKGAWRIIAHEFETKGSGTRRILSFLDDDGKEVLWFSQDVPAWPIGLRQDAAEVVPEAPTPTTSASAPSAKE